MSDQRKDTIDFYDSESEVYSSKRYFGRADTYVKSFFQRRMNIVITYLKKELKGKENIKILDIGCADGIVTRSVAQHFGNSIDKIIGVDISPKMIEIAKRNIQDTRIDFLMKEDLKEEGFDIVLAMGYLSYPIAQDEFRYVKKHIKSYGLYIVTLASNTSIHAILKVKDKPYFADYKSYDFFEEMLSENFEIIKSVPVGFFVPKLWSFPFLARIIQPILENMFKYLLPSLFHEKVYILRQKSDNMHPNAGH